MLNPSPQGWPKELSDANKIAESGFLTPPEPTQMRKGLANLMPRARGSSLAGNSIKDGETSQAFTAAYATWGLDNDSVVENSDRQMTDAKSASLVSPQPNQQMTEGKPASLVSAQVNRQMTEAKTASLVSPQANRQMTEAKTASLVSLQAEATRPLENRTTFEPDIASMDTASALLRFGGPGVEINQTIDWTGKRIKIQTASFGVFTESWTPSADGKMLYDMVLQDELRRELYSEHIDTTGMRTAVRTFYADEDGNKSHMVAKREVTKSDGSKLEVICG